MKARRIDKETEQGRLAAWGIEHKPWVLDQIKEALNWKRFETTLRKVFKAPKRGRPSYLPVVLFNDLYSSNGMA